jgi:hypothetical protein
MSYGRIAAQVSRFGVRISRSTVQPTCRCEIEYGDNASSHDQAGHALFQKKNEIKCTIWSNTKIVILNGDQFASFLQTCIAENGDAINDYTLKQNTLRSLCLGFTISTFYKRKIDAEWHCRMSVLLNVKKGGRLVGVSNDHASKFSIPDGVKGAGGVK